jgi:hypothetical protein
MHTSRLSAVVLLALVVVMTTLLQAEAGLWCHSCFSGTDPSCSSATAKPSWENCWGETCAQGVYYVSSGFSGAQQGTYYFRACMPWATNFTGCDNNPPGAQTTYQSCFCNTPNYCNLAAMAFPN